MIRLIFFLISICAPSLLCEISIQNDRYDTIVVGLGSAGATAASTLAAAGQRVLALEAQNRIGGRVNTVKFGNGLVEMGAEWIHGDKSSRVYDAAIKNNITILSQGLSTLSFFSNGTLPDQALIADLFKKGLEFYDDALNVTREPEPVGIYVTREILKYIYQTRPQLIKDQEFIQEFLAFLDLYIDTNEASDNWNDVTTYSEFEELDGDQTLSWHIYGYKTFFDILLNTYNNSPGYPTLDIKLNKEVTKITWSQDGVVVTCHDGTNYAADNVIVTVSVGVLKKRHTNLFLPNLPVDKQAAIRRTAIGVMNKILLLFDEPFWPKDVVLFAFIWTKDQKERIPSEDFWMTKISGATVSMASKNVLTLWFTGEAAKFIETLPEEELKKKSVQLLRMFIDVFNVTEPKEITRSTWYSNEFTRGSFSYNDQNIAKYPETRSILARPLVDNYRVPRVLFAGEATNEIHFATVHGSSETGYREARRILDNKLLK